MHEWCWGGATYKCARKCNAQSKLFSDLVFWSCLLAGLAMGSLDRKSLRWWVCQRFINDCIWRWWPCECGWRWHDQPGDAGPCLHRGHGCSPWTSSMYPCNHTDSSWDWPSGHEWSRWGKCSQACDCFCVIGWKIEKPMRPCVIIHPS